LIHDVIIIGAGVVGGAVARQLGRYNLDVLCLEKEADVSAGISRANTGIIHSAALVETGTRKHGFCLRGNRQFPLLSEQLGFRYQKKGALVLAYTREDREVLEHYLKRREALPSGYLSGDEEYRILSREELREREPEIGSDVRWALLLPDAGQIIPYEYGIALWENAVANGVRLELNARVERLSRLSSRKGAFWQAETTGGTYRGRFLVNAAGHGSRPLGLQAGMDGGEIRPVRGEYLLLERETGPAVNHILFQVPSGEARGKGKGILVTRTVYGNLMIGPDARPAGTEENRADQRKVLEEIMAGGLKSIPGLDYSRVIRIFQGVRPKPTGGDFFLEAKDSFIHLSGIESPGLTSSPALAEEVLELLFRSGLKAEEKKDWISRRTPVVEAILNFPPKELEERIRLAPWEPLRIVCRCEQVPESRILDSMNRGIPVETADGVKRRTRAGQGRCQGAFCRSRVTAILSEFYGREAASFPGETEEQRERRFLAEELRKSLRAAGKPENKAPDGLEAPVR